MAKKQSKAKKENTDLAKLKVLKDKLKEIQERPQVMNSEEQKIIKEVKEELNEIENLIKLKNK
tara:strand:- start:2040 stop:2228 length:189 start_codon:yes stop_codon:yes gene_type:complete